MEEELRSVSADPADKPLLGTKKGIIVGNSYFYLSNLHCSLTGLTAHSSKQLESRPRDSESQPWDFGRPRAPSGLSFPMCGRTADILGKDTDSVKALTSASAQALLRSRS